MHSEKNNGFQYFISIVAHIKSQQKGQVHKLRTGIHGIVGNTSSKPFTNIRLLVGMGKEVEFTPSVIKCDLMHRLRLNHEAGRTKTYDVSRDAVQCPKQVIPGPFNASRNHQQELRTE